MRRLLLLFKRLLTLVALLVLSSMLLGTGGESSEKLAERVRVFTRDKEFNFIEWTLEAWVKKAGQMALGSENYLEAEQRRQVVIDYLDLVWEIWVVEAQVNDIYADPNITEPQAASSELREQLNALRNQRDQIALLAEAVLQDQVSDVVGDMGLTLGGQPIPPVLYHATTLPWALIASPREVIRQDAHVSLSPELSVDQHVVLEQQVEQAFGVSSVVVGIGGVGVYPTMVRETTDLNWLSEVIAHEWVHNFLMLRPLGLNYMSSVELRTMNETTASIAGVEIGMAVIEKYYPELLPPDDEVEPEAELAVPQEPVEPEPFNFYKEMGITRVQVDRLLADGQVEQAEQYMEARRRFFWDNGYHIRKLNQAWFAFHGAYADQPGGGAAGEDPVGKAVRDLRADSTSLAEFLKRISWMASFDQLQAAVQNR
ncbi:MAG: hypothetical protein MUE67_09035 [Anaerolineales bacterium]|jgi:hypothetical protein|nr:hypothetical protein [Anaerolineales bacterium]